MVELAVIEGGRVPHKWRRVLAALLTGRSFNRFEAERDLSDHCLHSTVSTIQAKGVRIARKTEQVPGYQGIPTECCRYWIAEDEMPKARALLERTGRELKAVESKLDAGAQERLERAVRAEERWRLERLGRA